MATNNIEMGFKDSKNRSKVYKILDTVADTEVTYATLLPVAQGLLNRAVYSASDSALLTSLEYMRVVTTQITDIVE